MPFEEFVIAVVAIVAGVGLAGFIFSNIFKLLRTWLGRDSSYDAETFERLARAFMQHKKETERRIQHLEAIIADEEEAAASKKQIEEPAKTIEIEEEEEHEKAKSSGGSLRNMLRE